MIEFAESEPEVVSDTQPAFDTKSDQTPAPAAAASPVGEALATINRHVAEISIMEIAIADIEHKYANVVFDVTTTAGYEQARVARAEAREVRYAIQTTRKLMVKPLNQIKADVTSYADQAIERVLNTETPIDEQMKAEDNRKAVAKAAREQAERDKAEAIAKAFASVAFNPALVGAPIEALTLAIEVLDEFEVTIDIFGDRAGEALQTKMATLDKLDGMLTAARELEAGRAALAAERAAFAAEQAAAAQALADQQATLAADREKVEREARIARMAEEARTAEARRIEDERLAAERKQQAEAAAAAQKILDDAAAAERQRLDDEAAAARAEQEKIDAADRRVREAAHAMLATLRQIHDGIMGEDFLTRADVQDLCAIAIRNATGVQL